MHRRSFPRGKLPDQPHLIPLPLGGVHAPRVEWTGSRFLALYTSGTDAGWSAVAVPLDCGG